MKTLSTVVLLWICTVSCAAQAQTLSALWDKVASNHPKIIGAKARIAIARERDEQASGVFYPRIGVQADMSRAKNESLNINNTQSTNQTDAVLRWNLFNGFADVARKDSIAHEVGASKEDLADNSEELALLLTESYVNVLTLERQTQNAQLLVSDLSVLLDTVKSSVSIGRNPESDLIQATTKMLQARGYLSEVKGKLAGARARLAALVGIPVGELVEPVFDDRLLTRSTAELLSTARAHHPQLAAAKRRAQQSVDEVRVAKGDLYPKLNFEGRKNIQRNGNRALVGTLERETNFQITYEYALGRTPYHRVNEARERQLAAEAAIKEIELDLQGEIGETYESLVELATIAPQLQDRQRAATGVFDAYRWQFNAGRRTLLDLITVREDQYSSGEAVTANIRNRLLGTARLYRLVGQLRGQLMVSSTKPQPPKP